MTLEWCLVALSFGATLCAFGWRFRSARAWLLLSVSGLAAFGSAGWWHHTLRNQNQARAALLQKTPATDRADGYVRSDTCRSCHPEQYASWHRSFHRTMTQLPSRETVRGNFEDVTLELDGQKFHLQREGDEFWVEMVDPDWNYVQTLRRAAARAGQANLAPLPEAHPPRTRKRISLLTGSHFMQAYWTASDYGNMQFSFPFTFVFDENRWVPRNDVFLMDPNIQFNPQVWNVNCINCHVTAGQPRQDPKTKVIDSRAAELGISCEACHGPAQEHVRLNQDPTRRYALHRTSGPDSSIFNPARADHIKSSEACGQCHAIRRNVHKEQWNREGVGFRPGQDIETNAPLVHYDDSDIHQPGMAQKRALMEGSFWSDGQVRVSGREFSGLTASGCYQRGQISCLSCHSLHRYQDPDDQLGAGMESNQACVLCHDSIAAKLEQHTHHPGNSSGSLCYNCHMPHTTYGLVKAIRSHLIDSPTVQSSLKTGRPNACNLCHLDRPLEWTSRALHEWYQQPLASLAEEQKSTSAALLWLLRGDAGQRAIVAWHMGWEPARQVSGESWMPAHLAEILIDPYSTVRAIAGRSLRRLSGFTNFTYNYIAPASERDEARRRALALWHQRLAPAPARETVLLQPNGQRQEEKIAALLRQRNNRRMELLE